MTRSTDTSPFKRAPRFTARRDASPRGFALLMALVLVLLAGVALAGVARRSATEALHARTDLEHLQHRWAVRSLRALLAPRIAPTLAEAGRAVAKNQAQREPTQGGADHRDTNQAPPARSIWLSVDLAGTPYDLRFTDEQAKVDLNRLLEAADVGTVRSVIEDLIPSHVARRNASVDIDPHALVRGDFAAEAVERLDAITGWGQVFDPADPSAFPALLAGSPDRAGLIDHLALTGGPINIDTAPDAVVRTAGAAALGVYRTEQLLQARAEQGGFALRSWLSGQSDWEDRQRAAAAQWFTETSNTHGLWIIARGRQRDRYHWTLARTAAAPDGSPGSKEDESTEKPTRDAVARARPTALQVMSEARETAARPRLMIRRLDFDW